MLPEAMQIGDRFHIIKGFIEAATKAIRAELQKEITIEMQIEKPENSQTQSVCEAEAHPETKEQENTRKRAELRLAKAEKARQMRAEGHTYREVSKQTGLSYQTIRKYESEGFEPKSNAVGGHSELYEYWDEAESMLSEGKSASDIHKALKGLGYKGSIWAIRRFIDDRKQQEPEAAPKAAVAIKREHVEMLLLMPIENVDGISEEAYQALAGEFPWLEKLYELAALLREIMAYKLSGWVLPWIQMALELGLKDVTSYANGLCNDFDAVINAAEYSYSNGLAEGTINKLKLFKRVMYGRASIELLEAKLMYSDEMFKPDTEGDSSSLYFSEIDIGYLEMETA